MYLAVLHDINFNLRSPHYDICMNKKGEKYKVKKKDIFHIIS